MALMVAGAAPAPAAGDLARRRLRQSEQDQALHQTRQHAAEARAHEAERAAAQLAARRVAAAAKQRQADQAVADALARLDTLKQRQATAQRDLQARAAALAPMLPIMERLSRFPAETMLAVPTSPERALQGLTVLHLMSVQLARQAQSLRDAGAVLNQMQDDIAAEMPRLQAAQSAQAAASASLDADIAAAQARWHASEDEAVQAGRQAETEAAQAQDLRTAIAELDAARERAAAKAAAEADHADRTRHHEEAAAARRREAALSPMGGTDLLTAHGQLLVPVAGTVVRHWGDPTGAGPAQGVSYQPAPGARVVSACTGKIVFAGPFRSYGKLLIVACGGHVHLVLAGLDRLDAAVGQNVGEGEPVGVMAGAAAAPDRRPLLYLELRQGDRPVNPGPYLGGGVK